SRLAYLAANNQVKQIALQMKQAEYDYGAALIRLNLWLVSDTLFTVTQAGKELLTQPILLTDSLARHPVLQVAEQRMHVTEAERKAATADFLPKLNALYG